MDIENKHNLIANEMDLFPDDTPQIQSNTSSSGFNEDRGSQMSKSDFDRLSDESDKLMSEVVVHMEDGPRSKPVQKLISRHYRNLRHFYEPTIALYRGLATLYVQDNRFSAYFSKFHPGLPRFMHDAMIAYCDTEEAKVC